jgi:hypothetical protein
MRRLAGNLMLLLLVGCSNNEMSWISIQNDTSIPIYALPYTSAYTSGDWIHPGFSGEFYSINCDCLDAYEYFSFYYDSVIIYIKGYDHDPVKFFKDGKTVNYDPTLNPFTNPGVWKSHEIERNLPTNGSEGHEMRQIMEHFFSIKTESVKSLADTVMYELNPAF